MSASNRTRSFLTSQVSGPRALFALTLGLGLLLSLPASAQTSIYDVQYTVDPSGDSPLAGTTVTVEGVVTAASYYGFFVADAPGAWNGVFVYTQAIGCDVEVGDNVTVTGEVSEYFGMTEIAESTGGVAVSCTINSSGNPVTSTPLSTVAVNDESYEGVLVTVSNADVTALNDYGEWNVDDGSGAIGVDDDNDYRYAPTLGDTLASLTGVVAYSYSIYEIQPRVSDDIQIDPLSLHFVLRGDVVTMNDTMDVLVDHYVEVEGEHIVGISDTAPGGVQVVEVDGLIYPGLIDPHNHPQYNVLGFIPFGQLFQNRGEWRSTQIYSDFSTQLNSIWDYPTATGDQYYNAWKLAEVRAMAAGTTMIQGSNTYSHSADAYARNGMGINNVGRFPSHAQSQTFPLSYAYWDERAAEYWNRFHIHLSEGVDSTALNEFSTWVGSGMLDERTAIIHGVPYGPTEWAQIASAGAHLIWSPRSNWVLYGTTANVPEALAAGVNVALSVDWTESGSRDLLEEIQFADQINDSEWGGVLTPEFFALSVTRYAALAMGIQDRVGQIAAGYQADLAVFPGNPASPYDALLQADPQDVELTVVGGKPVYGDPVVMDQFTTLENVEDLVLCGTTKRLAVAVDHWAIPESDKPFSQVMSELQEAYDNSAPKICEFMGIDPCEGGFIFGDGFESGDTSAWTTASP